MARAPTTTTATTPQRPAWPYPELVRLYAHPSGQWARRYTIPGGRRRTYYFGLHADPIAALAEWRRRDPAIRAGTEAELSADSLPRRPTLRQLSAAYLKHRAAQVSPSGISIDTYRTDLHASRYALRIWDADRAADSLSPPDFTRLQHRLAASRAPSTIASVIGGIRRMYRWANEEHGFPLPIYGSGFRPPKRRAFRKHRRLSAEPIYTPREIRTLLAAAGPTLRAAIYLAINGGIGATDLAAIPAIALQRRLGDDSPTIALRARIAYPRAKTEIMRSVSVWPETVRAILIAQEHTAQRTGGAASPWLVPSASGGPAAHTRPGAKARTDTIGRAFTRLLARFRAAEYPARGSFYLLRHTFATRADILGDRDTRRLIMGHAAHAMDEVYVHQHGWTRVEDTCEALRRWLFDADAPVSAAHSPDPQHPTPSIIAGPYSGALPHLPAPLQHKPGSSLSKRKKKVA